MIVIDRWFVELERVAGDSTNSAMNVTGMKGNAAILVSLHVECYDGYSGDDCGCEEDMECGMQNNVVHFLFHNMATCSSSYIPSYH